MAERACERMAYLHVPCSIRRVLPTGVRILSLPLVLLISSKLPRN
eukprot:COSAG02_NODE_21177_length_799_cov_0.855714_1_plen_44_part_10